MREYESLVAWDFHKADGEWAQSQAKFMAADLELLSTAAAGAVQVNVRKHRVELSMRAVNKGRLVSSLLESMHLRGSSDTNSVNTDLSATTPSPNFIFTAGDDVTDEEMFVASQKWFDSPDAPTNSLVVNVLVGRNAGISAAKYSLSSVADVQAFIVALYEASKSSAVSFKGASL